MGDQVPPDRARGGLPEAPLSVVATLAAIAAMALFFWSRSPDNIDPQVSATLRDIRAGQQQITSGIEAVNDRLAAERLDLKMIGSISANEGHKGNQR